MGKGWGRAAGRGRFTDKPGAGLVGSRRLLAGAPHGVGRWGTPGARSRQPRHHFDDRRGVGRHEVVNAEKALGAFHPARQLDQIEPRGPARDQRRISRIGRFDLGVYGLLRAHVLGREFDDEVGRLFGEAFDRGRVRREPRELARAAAPHDRGEAGVGEGLGDAAPHDAITVDQHCLDGCAHVAAPDIQRSVRRELQIVMHRGIGFALCFLPAKGVEMDRNTLWRLGTAFPLVLSCIGLADCSRNNGTTTLSLPPTAIAVKRYTEGGALDAGFSGGAVATKIDPSEFEYALAVALQSGKIIAAGHSVLAGQGVMALVRYNTDGSLDTGFGSSGIVRTAVPSVNAVATAVVVQPGATPAGDKILVAGSTFDPSTGTAGILLARYTANGTLDATFAGGFGDAATRPAARRG